MNKGLFQRVALFAPLAFLIATFYCSTALQADEPEKKVVTVPGDKVFDYGDEPIRYLENERVKLGLDLSLGGAVVYLEDKTNKSGNMINSYDWGRQIQLSYYSGPNPYVGPNGEKPSPSWAGLGWNPIQSGDCGGYRSQVLEFRMVGKRIAVLTTRPMLWSNSGVPAECVFKCRYQLTKNGFTLEATIVNNRSDKTQYSGRDQETPALYTNAPWYKLVSYLGDKPFENEPTTVLVDKNDGKGWPWLTYYTPERWSALVNENDFGVGVYQPFSTETSAGFHGGDEPKGQDLDSKANPTGYIAPRETTILDYNIERTYRATFIVGSLEEIRSTVYGLAKKDLLGSIPNWTFEKDRDNWSYRNVTDEGYPIDDALNINLSAEKQGVALSPVVFWKTEDAKLLEIDAMFTSDDTSNDEITINVVPVSPADSVDYLQWSEGNKDQAKDRAEKEKTHPRLPNIVVKAPVKFDGKRHFIRVDLSKEEGYENAMKRLEIVLPQREGKAVLYRVGFNK